MMMFRIIIRQIFTLCVSKSNYRSIRFELHSKALILKYLFKPSLSFLHFLMIAKAIFFWILIWHKWRYSPSLCKNGMKNVYTLVYFSDPIKKRIRLKKKHEKVSEIFSLISQIILRTKVHIPWNFQVLIIRPTPRTTQTTRT